MKKILAAMLTVLMLLTFLPLASPPARAVLNFSVKCTAGTVAYVGETFVWYVDDLQGSIGPSKYSFDIIKDDILIDDESYHTESSRMYTPTSPGRYKVWVNIFNNHTAYAEMSAEITVYAQTHKITKVEPLGPTSLKISWTSVPGATEYYLYRSTNKNSGWEFIKTIKGTSFSNTYLQAGTRYFYRMWYRRLGVWGPICPVVSGVPMAKTRITSITSPSARRIRMTWAKAAGASGYQVAMASRANGSYKSVRIVTGGTTAIFSGVRSGSTLFFKVRPYRRVYTTTYWGQYSAYRSVRVK
ncbi:MAG: fibronectin type III domain-containing protein [Bacillota bacterium]|nr:fibronectin type III domain-containing protein [Bacillota bacterium]